MITNLVGNRIRELRAKRKMTQQQLADRADVPRATLATIEKDESNPSLAAVYKIAVALECSIDDLLETDHNRVEVSPKEGMGRFESGNGCYRSITISPQGSSTISQQLFELDAGSTYNGKPHPPGSEEYLHITKGELVLEIANENTTLHAGDSAHFRGNIKHNYHNRADTMACGIVTILEFPDDI